MDERTNIPVDNTDDADNVPAAGTAAPPDFDAQPPAEAPLPLDEAAAAGADDRMGERLERLGGEPAPVITPEEFARLQRAGQVHIDARGRVKTARPSDVEAGVSLKKRRAWYGQ